MILGGTRDQSADYSLFAVCFDLDGVIALTEPLKAKAHTATVTHFGGKATFEDYLELMGSSHETVRSGMMAVANIQVEPQNYSEEFQKIYHRMVEDELVIRPGAVELVKELHEMCVNLAVVSSSTRAMVQQVLEIAGISGLFKCLISADKVSSKKPDPEPYLRALERMVISPDRAVIIEDSPSGIEAGKKAGSNVIAVRHNMNIHQSFDQADAWVEDFDNLPRLVATITSFMVEEKE